MHWIVKTWKQLIALLAVVLVCTGCGSAAFLSDLGYNPWQVIQLPTDANVLDLSFTGDPNHGWLVGAQSTLLETQDGGQTWKPQQLALGEQPYRFSSVSFRGQEGWIVGQPSILLHSLDGGQSWTRVTLSEKLPGAPNTIVALGAQTAEMTTDVGAIYRTSDGGKTWKAMVEEAVGVVRNIARSDDGKYVAVSSRGNFYSIWEPGQAAWSPQNRNSSRRLQNMGFTADGRLWLLARGGQIQFSNPEEESGWDKPITPEFASSWGLLDLAYRTPKEIWVAGGGGNLLCSLDGGKTWVKDKQLDDVPSNFYRIIFLSPDKGFVIGQQGTLLRYQAAA